MPMDFPDMKSLIYRAKLRGFREPNPGETEESYRKALADDIEPIDYIESLEIRNKVGWDKFTEKQNKDMLRRRRFNI